ncbi:MAG: DUF3343 domain-containing protein [Thermoleophilia bacterium]|nr:DUF3343 domain-containing protein [Thermoleophilia bacterium]
MPPTADIAPTTDTAVITFDTTHQAMVAEDILRQAGFPLEVVPPPRSLSAGCGLALRLALADIGAALAELRTRGAGWAGAYRLDAAQQVVARVE